MPFVYRVNLLVIQNSDTFYQNKLIPKGVTDHGDNSDMSHKDVWNLCERNLKNVAYALRKYYFMTHSIVRLMCLFIALSTNYFGESWK